MYEFLFYIIVRKSPTYHEDKIPIENIDCVVDEVFRSGESHSLIDHDFLMPLNEAPIICFLAILTTSNIIFFIS
jgi:hypothetical protein